MLQERIEFIRFETGYQQRPGSVVHGLVDAKRSAPGHSAPGEAGWGVEPAAPCRNEEHVYITELWVDY